MKTRSVSDQGGISRMKLLVALVAVMAAVVWGAIQLIRGGRFAANEASAMASLRSLNTAEITYASTYNSGFTDNLRKLAS